MQRLLRRFLIDKELQKDHIVFPNKFHRPRLKRSFCSHIVDVDGDEGELVVYELCKNEQQWHWIRDICYNIQEFA